MIIFSVKYLIYADPILIEQIRFGLLKIGGIYIKIKFNT